MILQRYIVSFCLLACIMLGSFGCEKAPDVASDSSQDSEHVTQAVKTFASWPPESKNGIEVVLASNLLAVNYLVVLDGSSSMDYRECSGNITKEKAAEKALAYFAGLIPDDANIGLVAFDDNGITERFSLSNAGEHRAGFIKAMRDVAANSSTPLASAIKLGYAKLEEQGRRQLGYGEYHLIVVTDGDADYGEDPEDVVDYVLRTSPVIIHTIGFCIGTGHSLNQPGRIIYKAADSPKELEEGLSEVVQAESEAFQDAADFTQ